MIHPHTELKYISPEMGHGVVATQFIPAGTITWTQDQLDRVFTPEEFNHLDKLYQNILDVYSFKNNKGNLVLCWDNGRYVNHSFNSNCLSTAYDFEIAIRDIKAGEQLTDDYGYLNISYPFRGIDEGTRRKVVYPNDLIKYYKVWDNKIKKVFPKILTVEQPLKGVIEPSIWGMIEKITQGDQLLESILSNYYNDENYLP
jgi:uncharacterized protein